MMTSIDYSKYKAFVFDLDGTLADTMPLHYEACNAVCKVHGFEFPLDYFYQEAGKPTLLVFQNLVKLLNLPLDGLELGKAKEAMVLDLLPKVGFVPSVYDIFVRYKGDKKYAIGSGGQAHTVNLTLKYLGLSNKDFGAIVSADDVCFHKPHPETFLKAAYLLKLQPADCLVFEDGDPGIEAAKAAGMDYVDVR